MDQLDGTDDLPPLKAMKRDNCTKSNLEDFEMTLGQDEEESLVSVNESSSGNDIVKLEIPEDFSESEEIEEIEFDESFSGQCSTDHTIIQYFLARVCANWSVEP